MFFWSKEFETGIAEIDQQHHRLFELLNSLDDISKRKDDYDHYDEIMEVFQELRDYTVYHFKYEEELMEKCGYEKKEMVSHKFEHGAFVMKMLEIEKADLDKEQGQILAKVISFATDWIVDHIFKTDKKYVPAIKSNAG